MPTQSNIMQQTPEKTPQTGTAKELDPSIEMALYFRPALDYATIGGLAAAAALLALAVALGGAATLFLDLPSFLLVVGGTLAITTASFSIEDVKQTGKILRKAMIYSVRDASQVGIMMIQLAEQARKAGPLTLETLLPQIQHESFLYRTLSLVVDGTALPDIERILRKELSATMSRHLKSASILRRAADVAPAMGLIGTLVGLVQMLGFLDSPDKIGPSMALALLTTLYGALLANLVFLPLAAKLERNSSEEELINTLYMTGASSIMRKENPRRLEMMINTVLPPAKRIQYFN